MNNDLHIDLLINKKKQINTKNKDVFIHKKSKLEHKLHTILFNDPTTTNIILLHLDEFSNYLESELKLLISNFCKLKLD